jgi:hypothetical protein
VLAPDGRARLYNGNLLEPISFYYYNYNLEMTDDGSWSGTLLAAPSYLYSDGMSFNDYWYANGTKQNSC